MVCADLNSVAARVKAIWNRLENIFYPPLRNGRRSARRFIRFFADTRAKRCHFSEHIEEILNGYERIPG